MVWSSNVVTWVGAEGAPKKVKSTVAGLGLLEAKAVPRPGRAPGNLSVCVLGYFSVNTGTASLLFRFCYIFVLGPRLHARGPFKG